PVELALEDPVRVAEAGVREDGLHRIGGLRRGRGREQRALVVAQRGEQVAHASSPVPVSSLATCSIVRPLLTDSGCVLSGLRRASAPSSRRLISSHCGLRPPSVRWSVHPPWSFSPSSQTFACPASSASAIERSSS